MLFHGGSQFWIDIAFKVIRYLAPYLFTADYHGLFPFAKDRRSFQIVPNPGASRSRNIRRARKSRVLTAALEMPNVFAVSSMLRCCMSRSTKTSRYLSASEA